MKFSDEHPVLAGLGFVVGTLVLARVIQTGLGLDFGAGPLIWVGLMVLGGFIGSRIREGELRGSETAREIHHLRYRTKELERELRQRDGRGSGDQ